jgi:hypothetical protein
VIKWEEDRFEKEQLIKNIAEYHKTHFGAGQGFESFKRVTSHSPSRHGKGNLPNIDKNPLGQTQRGWTTTAYVPKRNKTTKT